MSPMRAHCDKCDRLVPEPERPDTFVVDESKSYWYVAVTDNRDVSHDEVILCKPCLVALLRRYADSQEGKKAGDEVSWAASVPNMILGPSGHKFEVNSD